jgi:hypothetical protein
MRMILPKFIALTLPSRGGFDKKAKEISTRELEDDRTRFMELWKTGGCLSVERFCRFSHGLSWMLIAKNAAKSRGIRKGFTVVILSVRV